VEESKVEVDKSKFIRGLKRNSFLILFLLSFLIFLITKNVLFAVTSGILFITFFVFDILKGAKDFRIRVKEKNITKEQLLDSDEVFFTGTAAEVTPIRMIDNKKIGNGRRGPITETLQNEFYKIVHGKNKKYKNWLDFV